MKTLKITCGLLVMKNAKLIVDLIKNPKNFFNIIKNFDSGLTLFFLVLNGMFKVSWIFAIFDVKIEVQFFKKNFDFILVLILPAESYVQKQLNHQELLDIRIHLRIWLLVLPKIHDFHHGDYKFCRVDVLRAQEICRDQQNPSDIKTYWIH